MALLPGTRPLFEPPVVRARPHRPGCGQAGGHFLSDFSPFSSFWSSGSGGSLPYLARYLTAYFSFSDGSQTKHWLLARSCLSHQSPLALNSLATLAEHIEHSSSGTPCSSHHHPP